MLDEALTAKRSGDLARARELLETALEQWPGYRQASYHLGVLAFDRGDLEEAGRQLESAAEGGFPRAFSAFYYLGRTRILQRDFAAALESLEEALRRAPGFTPALLARGRAHLFLRNVDLGMADLRAAIESSEPSRQAAVLAAQLLMYLGRKAEAKAVVGALREESQEEEAWLLRAEWLRLALNGGSSSQAALEKDVGDYPEAGDLYFAMAVVHDATSPRRSGLLFRLALDHDSENPVTILCLERSGVGPDELKIPAAVPRLRSRLLRAAKLWEEGHRRQGVEIARGLLEVRPSLVPAHLLLAREGERVGDLWRAAWTYEVLLDWLGPVPRFGRDLAEVAQAMGATSLAVCGVEMALRGDPEDGSLYYLLGVIEADRGNTDAAIAAHERAFELGYVDVRIWLRLGELHFERMEIDASIAAYEKAMAMEPAAAEAVRSFALSSLTTEQHATLRRILEAHIEEHPEDVNTLYSLGVMSLRDNRLDEAREYFKSLAEIAPDHRQVHYNLGQIHLRQGETQAGQQEMERFRQIKAAEDEEWERHNQAHFRRIEAREAMDAGDPETAIDLYSQSVQEGTADLSDYLELASANLEGGHLAQAIQGYEGILTTYPHQRKALQGLRIAADRVGDSQKAGEAARKLEILDWPCIMPFVDEREDR